MPSPSRRRGYLDRELRRNDTVKSGKNANNANGPYTGCNRILPHRALTVPLTQKRFATRVETHFASPEGHVDTSISYGSVREVIFNP